MRYEKPFVIAEAGCNHKGEMEIAHELINTAAIYCKADAIKFQKRCPKELLTPEQVDQHAQLKEWCEQAGIIYSTSVWDMTSAKEIASLKPQFIKIPSACNTHFEMLQWLCDNYKGEIQLSFGMTTHEEEEKIVQLFEANGRAKDLVIFDCTSGYPVPYQDICLLEIRRLMEKYSSRVKSIGFSGHHLGIAVDVAAYTLGAHIIERHYTLDRTWKGTDHAASLEPYGIKSLVRDLNNVYESLTYKKEEILPIEQVQRDKLKYRKH